MPTAVTGPEIDRLIQLLARLPGLGPRSARRAALHLIKKREALMAPLAGALQVAIDRIRVCETCGNIDTRSPCTVCTDARRDPSIIVVVADVADLWVNATVDGQTTAHYITDLLGEANVKVTRLAHGVPVGGELDYLDEGTLSAAMRQRTLF
ncbi:MAG: RecR protein [Nitrobacter vulgaris]|nr:RecR protein [Nitrobacter vulgaris]